MHIITYSCLTRVQLLTQSKPKWKHLKNYETENTKNEALLNFYRNPTGKTQILAEWSLHIGNKHLSHVNICNKSNLEWICKQKVVPSFSFRILHFITFAFQFLKVVKLNIFLTPTKEKQETLSTVIYKHQHLNCCPGYSASVNTPGSDMQPSLCLPS